MKIDFVSDLHYDCWEEFQRWEWLKTQESDFIIVAGDVADTIEQCATGLEKIAEVYKHVYFIDGNHEYQSNRFATRLIQQELIKYIECYPNITYIPENLTKIETDDGVVGIVGVCGFWDFTFGDVDPDECAKNFWKRERWHEFPNHDVDFKVVKRNFELLASEDALSLLKQLDTLHNTVDKIIVATHVTCHPGMCTIYYPGPEIRYGCYGNPYFMGLAEKYSDKIQYWISGHSHDKKKFNDHGIQFMSNPRGRPSDFNRTNYSVETLTI
jgi:predicted phosphodiesterase